jgi:hypothetical protein
MILLASLRSDKWTAWPEHVVDFIGPGSHFDQQSNFRYGDYDPVSLELTVQSLRICN